MGLCNLPVILLSAMLALNFLSREGSSGWLGGGKEVVLSGSAIETTGLISLCRVTIKEQYIEGLEILKSAVNHKKYL